MREGVLRAFHRHGDSPRDVVSYSMLRKDWEASPLFGVPVAVTGEVPRAFVA